MFLIELVGQLAEPATRADAARALARALGAEDLVLFLRDPEVEVMLPAPGFLQTIPRGSNWRPFLAECARSGTHSGWMPDPRGGDDVRAWGYRISVDAVIVVFGGAPALHAIEELLPVLPLIATLARTESAMRTLEARAMMADAAVGKGEVLTRSIERSRDQLRQALEDARTVRQLLEEKAEELETAAVELEQSKEELEVINEELVATNDALHASNADADRARASAEEANLAKSAFLAMMSHELRTPLNAIGGYASLLEEGIMGPVLPGQIEYLSRIKRSQSHLLSLINDVLNFAKAESGTISYHIEPLSLGQLLAGVAPLIEPMAAANNVSFEFFPSAGEMNVLADRDKVAQVVLNLLTNAVKFTPPHGSVRLSVAETHTDALLRVSDTGPGIPAEQSASIFEPFVQLERSYAGEREGVGLGLSISRELARGMGGDILVESTPGQGATFTFSIPRASTGATADALPLAIEGLRVTSPH